MERAPSPRTFALADSLAKAGNIERAKGLAEPLIAWDKSALAKQPDNRDLKADLSQCLALLAGLLDPAKSEEASRRQSLLDQAAGILESPEMQGRLSDGGQELLAKIASLRGTAPKKPAE